MNVRLDEYLVLTRASHIFNMFTESSVKYLNANSDSSVLHEHVIKTSEDRVAVFQKNVNDIFGMFKSFEFILESIIVGINLERYVVSRPDKTMEYILLASYPHKRKDNGEIIDVQIPFMFTQTDIIAVSPFNAPDMTERFNSPNDYIIGILDTNEMVGLANASKTELIDFTFNRLNSKGKSVSDTISDILDSIATSIHMQTEYFLKDLQNVSTTGYRVINDESNEFKKLYSKYGKELDPEIEDIIKSTVFTPVLVKEGEINKSIIIETSMTDDKVVQKLVGIESFDELTDLDNVVNKEVLIRCPEVGKPLIIKLPSTYYYVGYNLVVRDNDETLTSYKLLESGQTLMDDSYVPSENAPEIGTESEHIKKVVDAANEYLLIPFKKFGIVKGTAIYEMIYPVLKLPMGVAKRTLKLAFNILKINSKLEKEKSEELKEQLLNDELDSSFVQIELFLAHFALFLGASFILGNFFCGIIAWTIFRNRNKKIHVRAIERTERRVVSKIREYDKKVEFATQESDYESVKKLNHIKDTYKAMLDKLREVKKTALGKEEKYTDTYAEYNQD